MLTETKTCSGCRQLLPLENFHKKSSGKFGRESKCRVCIAERDKLYREKNLQKIADRKKETYKKNKEIISEQQRVYRSKPENKKRASERCKKWREKNKSHYKEYMKDYSSKYYKENKEKIALRLRAREKRVRTATPSWLSWEDRKRIEIFYGLRNLKSFVTGVEYEVDHIVPLLGENVCGLHVPWNLQLLTKEENRAKSNKF